jgi:hypothetical protein
MIHQGYSEVQDNSLAVSEQTLLVNSKTRGKEVLHTTFEGQRDRGNASGETHSHGLGD